MVQLFQATKMLGGFLSILPASGPKRVLNDPNTFPPALVPSSSFASFPPSPPTSSTNNVSLLIQDLRRRSRSMQGAFLSPNGKHVDYPSLLTSEAFASYLQMTTHLATLTGVGALSPDERKATFLNLYNCLVIHALTLDSARPPSSSSWSRTSFYARTCYCVGGHILSLDDLENGLLRGNRRSPNPLARPSIFSAKHFPNLPILPPLSSFPSSSTFPPTNAPTDAPDAPSYPPASPSSPESLADWIVPLDARIHFALNCGANSCPAIRYYEAGGEGGREGGKEGGRPAGILETMQGGGKGGEGGGKLEQQLEAAARAFFCGYAGGGGGREGGREGERKVGGVLEQDMCLVPE
ncbi:glycoside hydrolase 15-like protein [Nannochloropsis gaditana]|uniref:Glycoside hydrolase 15-like protein n=1 Tax=Nannochloropsis gaditana TaxID=72520 RepID=W7TRS5_9STRA|nr:glycoside hydrolase 15-like protein [Nannochloropsis gaditana]